MKSKLSNTFSLLRLSIIAVLAVLCSSCDKTETTDSTGFILHYLGVTDIGPSMSYTLKAPTYKGSAPYDFTITNVTLNDETYSNEDNFVINAETGEITIQNTETMSAGLYNISVGCYSNGNFYNFKDAVQVNMLLAVPEGVTVEPAEVLVNQDEENWVEASAQVTTEKDKHVSITNYAIAQDESKPYLEYFSINNEGKITIKSGTTEQQLIAGESYTLSLKLTTKAGEHMYADAVTFKVVSKPRNLFYIEQESLPDLFGVQVEGKSVIPTIEGTKEGLKFAIKSVTPETNAFIIDETTGQISLPENHPLTESGTPYVFTITVENTYGSSDFEAVYSAKIVAFIEPIQPETFHYTAVDKLYQQGGSLENQLPDQGFIGGAPTFQFDESNSDEIKTQIAQNIISINSGTGAISIANNHTLAAKTHEIQVRVTNKKNEEGVVKALSVTVLKNPNSFTYVSWGTNIENEILIDPTKTNHISTTCSEATYSYNRNLFRFIHIRDVVDIPRQNTDNEGNSNFTYKIIKDNYIGNPNIINGANIDNRGTITFTKTNNGNFSGGGNYTGCVFQIEVTASGNGAPSVTKKIPIFISTPKVEKKNLTSGESPTTENQTLICTPFVVKANPKTGVCAPFNYKVYVINANANNPEGIQRNFCIKELPTDNLVWDYNSAYSYCNFDENSEHATGNNQTASTMLYQVWDNCGIVTKTDNSPMRFYDEKGNKDQGTKAGYINQSNQLYIDPTKWIGTDGKYPNGAMIGQMRFNVYGGTADLQTTNNVSVFPLIIWFDETYEGN